MDLTMKELENMIGRAMAKHQGALANTLSDSLDPIFRTQTKNFHNLAALVRGQEPKGGDAIGLLIRSFAAAGGDVHRARDIASKLGRGDPAEKVVRALGAGDAAGGGFLIQGELADEIIDALRPRSAVRALNPMVITAPKGTTTFPRLDTSASSGYISENADVTISNQVFGQVVLTARKLAGLVVVSNDLLRYTGGDADQIVRDDLLRVLSTTEDVNLIRGDGTAGAPKGLRNWAASGNVFAANVTVSLTNVTGDLLTAINSLEQADVPMLRPGWIMSPRTKNYLISLRDSNGNFAFKPEMDRGTLFGFPFKVTTNIPNNLGTGSDSEVYLADFSEVILGEVSTVELEASNVAAYVDETSTLRSAFNRDQTVVRVILRHDLAVKHPEAVAVITDVTWSL